MTLPFRWRLLLAALVAIAVGLLSLMYSERYGRLSMDLQFDDVSYAMDGLLRHEVLVQSGWRPFLGNLAASPPHSPYSTLLATAMFSVLGVHELSLYLGNLVVLLGAAVFVAILTRHRDDATFVLALGLVFGSTLAFHGQNEYRPDIAYGLVMAAMSWTFVSAAVESRPRLAAAAGVLLAVALLAKPSFFPHTLALASMLAFIAAVAAWRRSPDALRPLALAPPAIVAFLAIGLVLASPYYYFGWQQTFGYFWENTFGSMGHVHNLQPTLSPWQVLQSFMPHMFPLARYHFYATMVAAALLPLILALRGQRREACRVGVLAAVGFMSTLIILAGRQASLFFFATAAWAFFVAAICGFAAWAGSVNARLRPIAHGGATIAIVVLSCYGLVNLKGAWPPGASHLASANDKVLELLRNHLGPNAVPPKGGWVVFAGTAGPLNPVTLRWVGRLKGLSFDAPELQYVDDFNVLRDTAGKADFAVLANPAQVPFDQWLPISKHQQALLDWALANPGLQAIGSAGPGDAYRVFAKRHRAPSGPTS